MFSMTAGSSSRCDSASARSTSDDRYLNGDFSSASIAPSNAGSANVTMRSCSWDSRIPTRSPSSAQIRPRMASAVSGACTAHASSRPIKRSRNQCSAWYPPTPKADELYEYWGSALTKSRTRPRSDVRTIAELVVLSSLARARIPFSCRFVTTTRSACSECCEGSGGHCASTFCTAGSVLLVSAGLHVAASTVDSSSRMSECKSKLSIRSRVLFFRLN
ncbi:hypothetical protein DL89DRAFT_164724 [Linderina pennispora]|uniref:Uncharacterized protein n=1 Tax=Linderina pennispora TaxID=61395 RepID=A0A1Y1W826_9FUNG|nr:uncharacterized protein DL89DRAFT_164724 [Linderina pennispora]ORX69691.1 hypothetical protein DL89DRAFT_164724 [Linderina pennispora]